MFKTSGKTKATGVSDSLFVRDGVVQSWGWFQLPGYYCEGGAWFSRCWLSMPWRKCDVGTNSRGIREMIQGGVRTLIRWSKRSGCRKKLQEIGENNGTLNETPEYLL
jgi:hypothetical protein